MTFGVSKLVSISGWSLVFQIERPFDFEKLFLPGIYDNENVQKKNHSTPKYINFSQNCVKKKNVFPSRSKKLSILQIFFK